ncbi:hypothetical protein [Phytohabitans suffuscus]|uniref:Uncharacterized protein n=1 Tax=Phytohabitans suffuscus TaxID=624315 RepID=A0A6F8Z0P0_9ACTN|nr:hypothetical protein [Phytohabitans suffuscus]BCB91758.1 hypothetical protein Psuf_090710 [Phytohabitans suffuscus]
MTGPATVYTPLLVERVALRGAGAGLRVTRTGMGPRRAKAARSATGPVLVAGVGGGLAPGLAAGDLVVASEVGGEMGGDGVVVSPSAPLLAGALRRLGLRAHVGPVLSTRRLWKGAADAAAVDMESAWLAPDPGTPFAVVRAVVDTPDHPLWSFRTPARGVRALRALRRAVPALRWWAAATGARQVLLADPRPFHPGECDLVLVAGRSDAGRLVEVAGREGVPAYQVDDVGQVDLRWLAGAARLGVVTAETPSPPLVGDLVHCLSGLGPVTVRSPLPREVT